MRTHTAELEVAFREPLWIAFLEGLEPGPPGRALDLAPGGGDVALWLARRGWRVTVLHPEEEHLRALRRRADEEGVTTVEWIRHDPFGAGELGPLDEKAFDLAVGLGLFERALSTVDVDSVLYGLARVLVADGRALVSVCHEGPGAEEGGEAADGSTIRRRTEHREVGEDDPARPDNLSPLIPLVEVTRTYQLPGGATVSNLHLVRLWEMREIHQAAHRCLMDLSNRWKSVGGRAGLSVIELRVPPPYE